MGGSRASFRVRGDPGPNSSRSIFWQSSDARLTFLIARLSDSTVSSGAFGCNYIPPPPLTLPRCPSLHHESLLNQETRTGDSNTPSGSKKRNDAPITRIKL